MPPESRAAKRVFVTVGGISVVCIILSGVINVISQNKLTHTLDAIDSNVQKLAGPANVQENSSVDEILSAAAAKIIEQQKQIDEIRRGRMISDSAQEKAIKELRVIDPHTAIVQFTPLSNPDGEQLARQIVSILSMAHWQPQPARPGTLDFTGRPSPRGVHFSCNCASENEIPDAINIIFRALQESNIAIWRIFANERNMEPGAIGILVGAKPSDDSASDFVH
jgi:hypothetical protein